MAGELPIRLGASCCRRANANASARRAILVGGAFRRDTHAYGMITHADGSDATFRIAGTAISAGGARHRIEPLSFRFAVAVRMRSTVRISSAFASTRSADRRFTGQKGLALTNDGAVHPATSTLCEARWFTRHVQNIVLNTIVLGILASRADGACSAAHVARSTAHVGCSAAHRSHTARSRGAAQPSSRASS